CVCFILLFISRLPACTYPLSLHDALPICDHAAAREESFCARGVARSIAAASHSSSSCRARSSARARRSMIAARGAKMKFAPIRRSEEHTSELQSRENLVCRLLLEKKKKIE